MTTTNKTESALPLITPPASPCVLRIGAHRLKIAGLFSSARPRGMGPTEDLVTRLLMLRRKIVAIQSLDPATTKITDNRDKRTFPNGNEATKTPRKLATSIGRSGSIASRKVEQPTRTRHSQTPSSLK